MDKWQEKAEEIRDALEEVKLLPEEVRIIARILYESFPAPSEPAKNAMELAVKVYNTMFGEEKTKLPAAAALIQSSFEEWKASDPGKTLGGIDNSYDAVRLEINRLHGIMEAAPNKVKMGYSVSIGGILNAYREGDIAFEKAKEELSSLASRQSASEPSGEVAEVERPGSRLKRAMEAISRECPHGIEWAVTEVGRALLASRRARCGYDMGGECAVDKPAPLCRSCTHRNDGGCAESVADDAVTQCTSYSPAPTAEKAAGCTCGYSATESDRCKAHDKPTAEKALRDAWQYYKDRVSHILRGQSVRDLEEAETRIDALLSHESPKEQA